MECNQVMCVLYQDLNTASVLFSISNTFFLEDIYFSGGSKHKRKKTKIIKKHNH